jgi:hypothetical protein
VRCSIRSCRCRREESVNSASQRRKKEQTHLLDTRTEQLPQRCHDARLLSCSRRTVEKGVREITLRLRGEKRRKRSAFRRSLHATIARLSRSHVRGLRGEQTAPSDRKARKGSWDGACRRRGNPFWRAVCVKRRQYVVLLPCNAPLLLVAPRLRVAPPSAGSLHLPFQRLAEATSLTDSAVRTLTVF